MSVDELRPPSVFESTRLKVGDRVHWHANIKETGEVTKVIEGEWITGFPYQVTWDRPTGDETIRCDTYKREHLVLIQPTPPNDGFIAGKREGIFQTVAEEAVRNLLRWMGQDVNDANMKDTPKRVVKALAEMTSGYQENPDEILAKTFGDEKDHDEMVILKGIPFASMCSHHLLPFVGEVDVGYLPGKVVGLSKLARLVDCFAKRLQMQETLTTQIADALMKYLEARGAAVVVRASHSCMSCRGVRKPGAVMITSRMVGILRDNPEARAEFLQLCKD